MAELVEVCMNNEASPPAKKMLFPLNMTEYDR